MASFIEFRDSLIRSLDAHKVPYKLFGGAVVCLIDSTRKTKDLDIAIPIDFEIVERFIDALADCGFGDRDFISMQVYGEGAAPGENMHSTCHLETTNPQWSGLHVDLCFNLGEYSFDTMPSVVYNIDGLAINIVTFEFIAKMKANIFPSPREKDIADIKLIADHLGIDPGTGEPVQARTVKKPGFLNLFGGGKHEN